MKRILLVSFAALTLASASHAACYADYKAKQDNPLRLHYGVIELRGDCSSAAATSEVRSRLSGEGWTLLNILSVFGPEDLDTRKASAGPYYLRF